MKRIVITGATSMIGSAIIRSCLSHSVEAIYAVVRPGTVNLSHLPSDDRITVIECAIDQMLTLPTLIPEDCDTFYHIAWGLTGAKRNQNIEGQAVNITYTIQAVQAASALHCQRFIGAGSQAEYGSVSALPMAPESPVQPTQAYGIAKYAAGRLAEQEAMHLGLDFFWVRIFSVFGPYDKPSTMIAQTIRSMLANEHTSFTEGTQLWDYLYADDAGEAFRLIGEKANGCRLYCLGSGQPRMLRDYITSIRDLINPSLSIGLGEIPYGVSGPLSISADIRTLTADTGWMPSTSFEDGIRTLLHSGGML